MLRTIAAFAAALALAAPALSQPAPRAMVEALEGEPTEILVLGTPHLVALDPFDAAWLDPLLARLEGYAPDAILIEALPGWQIEMIRARADEYPGVAAQFAGPAMALADIAQAGLGIDRAGAEAELRAFTAGADRGPAARRRAAALFLAAYDPASALVQWLRLPPAERRAGDGLDAELAEDLAARISRRNESELIAAALAARLGHEQVFPFDDHSEKDIFLRGADAFVAAFQNSAVMGEVMQGPDIALISGAASGAGDGESLLESYRFMNGEAYASADIRGQWLSFLRADMDGRGRWRVAQWETRNLLMAAHARRALIDRPGARALIIVGAAHRPFLEDYLGRMMDVEIVPAGEVLGE